MSRTHDRSTTTSTSSGSRSLTDARGGVGQSGPPGFEPACKSACFFGRGAPVGARPARERARLTRLGASGRRWSTPSRRASTGCEREQLVRERICEPLGLADTRISIPSEALPRFADGHNRRGRPSPTCSASSSSSFAAPRRCSAAPATQPFTRGTTAAGSSEVSAGSACPPRRRPRGALAQRRHRRLPQLHRLRQETETGVVVLSNCARSVDAIGFRVLEAINQP